MDTLSELAKKGYKKNHNDFVETYIPNAKHPAKI